MNSRILVMLSLLACVGCNRAAKTRECQRLGTRVNSGLGNIENRIRTGSSAEYRAVSRLYSELAGEVRNTRLSGSSGAPLVVEFASVLDSSATATENYAAALEAQDARKQDDARRELERLTRHEQGLAARVDSYCEAP